MRVVEEIDAGIAKENVIKKFANKEPEKLIVFLVVIK